MKSCTKGSHHKPERRPECRAFPQSPGIVYPLISIIVG
jgi:hypothetical protein